MPVIYPHSNPLLYALQQGTGDPRIQEMMFSGGWSNEMIPDWYKELIGIPVPEGAAKAINAPSGQSPLSTTLQTATSVDRSEGMPQRPMRYGAPTGGSAMTSALLGALQYPYNRLRPRTIPRYARMGREAV